MQPCDLIPLLAAIPPAELPPASALPDALLASLLAGELTTEQVLCGEQSLVAALDRISDGPSQSTEGEQLCTRLRTLPPTSAPCGW